MSDRPNLLLRAPTWVGGTLIESSRSAGYGLLLLVRALSWLRSPRRVWKARGIIFQQMYAAGIESLPVTLVVALFVGFLLSVSAGVELARFGRQDLVGLLVPVAMCREFGPFMTGLILAANVGSSMAAELGTMKVSEEIDALEVMAIDPARFLVLPRVLAMLVMTPLLTIFSDVVGILGGALVGYTQLGVSWEKYYRNALDALTVKIIWTGLLKSALFGLIIATVSCSEGLRTSGGAVGVGRATRNSVITCYILILIFGYFGTSLFFGKKL